MHDRKKISPANRTELSGTQHFSHPRELSFGIHGFTDFSWAVPMAAWNEILNLFGAVLYLFAALWQMIGAHLVTVLTILANKLICLCAVYQRWRNIRLGRMRKIRERSCNTSHKIIESNLSFFLVLPRMATKHGWCSAFLRRCK